MRILNLEQFLRSFRGAPITQPVRRKGQGRYRPVPGMVHFVETMEARQYLTSVVVNTTIDALFPASSGLISLRNAVAIADASASPTAITFDPNVFTTPQTITLNGNVLSINNSGQPTTITGPSSGLTIDGTMRSAAFYIQNSATANISKLTITHCNNQDPNINNGNGGAIALSGSGATLTLSDSTLVGNVAMTYGGAIDGVFGTLNLNNDTFVRNTAGSYGGAISSAGPEMIDGCTIVANSAGISGGGLQEGQPTNVVNSIIAGNTATGANPDVNGDFNSLGHNLVGDVGNSVGWNTSDLTGTDTQPLNAKLGPLAANGGPTQTLLPLPGSPVIDHGINLLIPQGITTDQRGLPRIFNGTVDIGAVETQPPVVLTGGITGTVFNDANKNGALDTGEKGLAGVKVYIDANKNGALDTGEVTAATSLLGTFSFSGLAPGSYRIAEVLPVADALVAPAAGYFDVPVAAGKIVTGFLFADAQAASISGRVYGDSNGNGLRDPGEEGLGLWTVFIDKNKNGKLDPGETSVVTDINGNWSIKGLLAGTYVVRVVPVAGSAATKPTGGVLTLTLKAGLVSAGNLFGEKSIG